jgi:hypothetical protein
MGGENVKYEEKKGKMKWIMQGREEYKTKGNKEEKENKWKGKDEWNGE